MPDVLRNTRVRRWIVLTTLITCFFLLAWGDPLAYRSRGDRHEGTEPEKVSGSVELIGAMIEGTAPTDMGWPKRAEISFFLKEKKDVHLFARERRLDQYYWLNKVVDPGWRAGTTNTFSWPSGEVLKPLGVEPSNLIALARLGTDQPNILEQVAPVVVSPQSLPPNGTYRFVFEVDGEVFGLRWKMFNEDADELVDEKRLPDQRDVFDVVWSAEGRSAGKYRLLLEGNFSNNNDPVKQEVIFYHRPTWP